MVFDQLALFAICEYNFFLIIFFFIYEIFIFSVIFDKVESIMGMRIRLSFSDCEFNLVRLNVSSCVGDFFLLRSIIFLTYFLRIFFSLFQQKSGKLRAKRVDTIDVNKVVVSSFLCRI